MKNRIEKLIRDWNLPLRWNRARRGVLYGLILVLSIFLQNVILSYVHPFGVRCLFMPALVTAVALFEGGERGGWFGLGAGILSDLFYPGQGVLFTVLFPLMGFGVGFLTDFYLTRRIIPYLVLTLPMLLLTAVCQMFPLLVFRGENAWALWSTALLQALWSVPFVFPCYAICRAFPPRIGGSVPSSY